MHRCVIRLTLLVFACLNGCHGQLIDGNVERCNREGQVMEVPLLSNNPCYTCMCKNGSIQCSREICSMHYPCTYLVHKEGRCCRECLGCSVDNVKFLHNQQWKSVSQTGKCTEHICKDGVITREKLQCHVACSDPVAPSSGSCGCQVCNGCEHDGIELFEGETFTPEACVECTCVEGHTECRKKVCTVPVCERHQQILDDGGCCMVCAGQRLLYELGNGACWFRRSFLENEEEIIIDDCTTCVCKNGTVVCNRQVCDAELNCPYGERIRDGCCARCPDRILLNCTDAHGSFVEHGETWKDSRDPCLLCSCLNGLITCSRQTCPTLQTCPKGEITDKLPGSCCSSCRPEPGVCTVFGDPHYRSFDGRPFNFQGDCKYLLAKDCLGKNFSVVVENNAKKSPVFSWTNSVHLKLFNSVSGAAELLVTLYQRLVVKVNGQKIPLPYVNASLLIWVDNHVVKVRTSAGISLNWDGDSFLEVGASSLYRGSLCGLCGNFNGFPRDDFIGRDGSFKFDKDEFAKSWQVDAGRQCSRKHITTRSTEPCGNNLKLKLAARKACHIFKSKNFRSCFAEVNPADYYRSCMTDVCECPRNRKCSCESIRAYTAACFRQGIKLKWEEAYHCRKPCSHGKVYSSCGSPCKAKCKNIRRRRRQSCNRPCSAGCFCPAGYAIKGRKCVKISKCRKAVRKRGHNKHKSIHGNPLERYLKS